MYKYVKRVLDFLIAFILLILLVIPMLIIAIAIKLEDNGPALFKQTRTGKDGKEFKLMKFRSMRVNNDVHDFSTEDQYTKIGKFIRKTSLDELPQIFNILKGEMAFIGPRPWIPDYFALMNKKQKGRVKVLPGITGLAQAKGRNDLTIDEKIDYDLKYVKNLSLKQDIYVFFITIKAVLGEKGTSNGKGGIKEDLDALREENQEIIETNIEVTESNEEIKQTSENKETLNNGLVNV